MSRPVISRFVTRLERLVREACADGLAFTSTLMRGNRLSGTGDMIARALGAGINVRVFPEVKP